VLEQLYTIVNTRYEDGRALVLTTNLTEEQLEAQIGERTVSRIHEICGMPLGLFGEDHRKVGGDLGAISPPADGPAIAVRGPGRWRSGTPEDDDAFWEHGDPARGAAGRGDAARGAPAYGRPRGTGH
jgi:DNA replication protein DnaC